MSTPFLSARGSQAQNPAALIYNPPNPVMSRNQHLNERTLQTFDQPPMTSLSKVNNLLNLKTNIAAVGSYNYKERSNRLLLQD